MSAQHLRPLVAFVVVAILGAVVFFNTMQAQTVLAAIRTGAATVAAGNPLLHEPLFVVEPGQRLTPDDEGEGRPGRGSPDRAEVTEGEGVAGSPSGNRRATAGTPGQDSGRPAGPPDGDGAEEARAPDAGPKAEPAQGQTGPQRPGVGGEGRRGEDGQGHDRGDHDADDRGEHRGHDRDRDRDDRGEDRPGHDR